MFLKCILQHNCWKHVLQGHSDTIDILGDNILKIRVPDIYLKRYLIILAEYVSLTNFIDLNTHVCQILPLCNFTIPPYASSFRSWRNQINGLTDKIHNPVVQSKVIHLMHKFTHHLCCLYCALANLLSMKAHATLNTLVSKMPPESFLMQCQ